MPEGLSPIEVGKELHQHNTGPHRHDPSPVGDRHSRIVQIGEALLLSLVTIAAAWSGYAAAKWGTESRIEIAHAATLRNLATRADLSALSTRNFDSSTFNTWFAALLTGNAQDQALAERRFRLAVQRLGPGLIGELVLGHVGGPGRGTRVVEGVGRHPGVEGDPELRPEASLGDGLLLGVVQRVGGEPGGEGRGVEVAGRQRGQVGPSG